MSVEKFNSKTTFSHQAIPYVQANTHVVQNLKDVEALGVWIYLLSKPTNWIVIKKHLSVHFALGHTKIKRIFSTLAQHHLIEYISVRDENGVFVRHDVHVLNGESFICTTGTEIHLVDNPPTGKWNTTYKRNKQIKDKNKILSATDVAQSRFLDFWKLYPVRKNRARAEKLWIRKGCDAIADKILNDIKERMTKEAQWKYKEFIPHPSTYLNNCLWEDEIITTSATNSVKNELKSTVKFYEPTRGRSREEINAAKEAKEKAFSIIKQQGLLNHANK